MKPKVSVNLSEELAARLETAAEQPGVTKTSIIEAALDRFLDPERESRAADTFVQGINGSSADGAGTDRDRRGASCCRPGGRQQRRLSRREPSLFAVTRAPIPNL